MIQNFILMNGYGFFVWSSFVLAFGTCFIFYYKTLKTLKKHEKDFAVELSKLSSAERTIVLEKSRIATEVLASYNKSI